MQNLEKISVWKKAMELTTLVYLHCSDFPNEEKFGLTSQIKRCAVSIPSNIAEGAGRNSKNEFNQYLGISAGSAFELQTQILIAHNLKYLNESSKELLIEKIVEIQKMIYSFQKSLKT